MFDKKLIACVVLFAFIFTQLEQNTLGVLRKNYRQAALRPPIIFLEKTDFYGISLDGFFAEVYCANEKEIVPAAEVRKKDFFKKFRDEKKNITIKLPRFIVNGRPYMDFFPYGTFVHCRWINCNQDVFFNFNFSELKDDLDSFEKIGRDGLELKINRQQIDSSDISVGLAPLVFFNPSLNC